MPTTATIGREQRGGIYEVVRNHLGGLSDVWVALEEQDDYATAERLSLEFAEDLRLLQDIGWGPDEGRGRFELTIPREELMEVLRRLQGEAEGLIDESPGERESTESDEDTYVRIAGGLSVSLNDLLVGVIWVPGTAEFQYESGYKVEFEVAEPQPLAARESGCHPARPSSPTGTR